MKMKTSEILLKAKKRVEQGWCQKAFARAADNKQVASIDADAVSWCSSGALLKETETQTVWNQYGLARRFLTQAIDAVYPGMELLAWNDADGRTQEEVVAVFEAAYQLALKEEAEEIVDESK
jgi:hypothetical protein